MLLPGDMKVTPKQCEACDGAGCPACNNLGVRYELELTKNFVKLMLMNLKVQGTATSRPPVTVQDGGAGGQS